MLKKYRAVYIVHNTLEKYSCDVYALSLKQAYDMYGHYSFMTLEALDEV